MMVKPVPGPIFPIAAALLLVALAAPVAAVLLSVPPSDVVHGLSQVSVRLALKTSMVASLSATLTATVAGVPAGYWIAQRTAGWRAAALYVLALPLAFPPVASGIILLYVFGPASPFGSALLRLGIHATDSLTGVALSEFFVSGSFVAIASAAAFSNLEPAYADAARTLGVSEWKIFTRIALPAASAGIGAGIALGWLRALGEYGATSIVAYHPASLPVALYVTLSAEGVRPALAIAYAFVACTGVVVIAAWVLRRRVVL